MSRVKLIGVSGAARAAGLAEKTVKRLADEGVVKCERDSSNKRLFSPEAVETLRVRALTSTRQRA
jgi:DNA-binding transcriptional MerR regulator